MFRPRGAEIRGLMAPCPAEQAIKVDSGNRHNPDPQHPVCGHERTLPRLGLNQPGLVRVGHQGNGHPVAAGRVGG